MKSVKNLTAFLLAMLLFAPLVHAKKKNNGDKPVKVTRENFIKAETAHYFKKVVDKVGANKFMYYPGIGSEDNQIVVRTNRDVLYAQGIFCVKGGLTITTPKADRLIIVQILDENHYDLGSVFAGEKRTITEKDVSEGKFVQLTIRVGVKYDENGKPDLDKANKVMHAIKAQTKCNEPYNPPLYDQKSLDSLRAVLTAEFNPDPKVDNGEWTATFRLYKPKKGKADEVMQWGLNLAKKYDIKLKN